ncbi:putative alcohol dehydrogenase [Symbiodinium microadriaticum]|uniref:Alcohol dehydrogenase 4 n=1 Tax=Symbiodinium microadriaticum TaxID=2951 RepID=A0A1Q9C6C4_SYMMI|nr:putative alcohol dehydrogenase [Symbiodinium microadriaticum]
MTWGTDDAADWKAAAERAGNAVLAANPNLLIVVSALCFCMDLRPVKQYPIQFSVANRLVYETHNYIEFQVATLASNNFFSWAQVNERATWALVVLAALDLLCMWAWYRIGKPWPRKSTLLALVAGWGSFFTAVFAGVSFFGFYFYSMYCSYVAHNYFLPWGIILTVCCLLLLLLGAWAACIGLRIQTSDNCGVVPEVCEDICVGNSDDEKSLSELSDVDPLFRAHKDRIPGFAREPGFESLSIAQEYCLGRKRHLPPPPLPPIWDCGMLLFLQIFMFLAVCTLLAIVLVVFSHLADTFWYMRFVFDTKWGFALAEGFPYTAPVWMGEFGQQVRGSYWLNVLRYLAERDVDFAYWPLNGKKYSEGYFSSSGGFVYWDQPQSGQESQIRELTEAISKDLAGHTTQGAHGLNYHHKSPGDEGTTFFMPSKSLLGEGALRGAVQQIKALGHKKALIVTDAVLVKVGAVKAATDVLTEAGITFAIYDGCQPNPTVSQVEAGLKMIKQESCDFVLSFGGGSPHDCAKAIAITCTNGGDIRAMEGVDKSTQPMLTLVAVNTTAGTGAEMTRFCIITDEERHVKMAIVDWRVTPTLAVNDPKTMIGMPKSLTAATGMDALTHAIEAYVSTISNPVTDACALHAMKLISSYLPTAVEDGKNLKARDMMAYAEFLAGMAFNSASLGYVHAMAHQLGGMYNLPHGVCNAILLGPVQEYNAKYVPHLFIDIAVALGFSEVGEDQDLAVKKALKAIKDLKNRVGIPKRLFQEEPRNLKAFKEVKVEHFPALAGNAMKDACGLTNPHQPTKDEVIALFQAAYDQEDDDVDEVEMLQKQLSAAAARCKDAAALKKAMWLATIVFNSQLRLFSQQALHAERRWEDESFGLLMNDSWSVRHTWKLLDIQALMDSPVKWTPEDYPCVRQKLGSACGY